jgi:hypothetical protein
MAITSSFANLATVTRTSKKTDAGGCDFTNGGAIGTLTEYASNVAAIHPAAGLLVEESSTNEIPNPRGVGGSTGTNAASVQPTGWAIRSDAAASFGVGTTVHAVETGDDPYYEVSIDNTGGGATSWYIRYDSAGVISAADDEDWTFSLAGIQLISGDLTGFTAKLRFITYDGANSNPNISTGTDVTSYIGASRAFVFNSETISDADAASVVPDFVLTVPADGVVRLRLYAPQAENLPYPTSLILPAGASTGASTRAADDIVVANGSWSNDDGDGTIFAEFAFTYDGQASNFPRVLGYGADSSNRVDVYRNQATESLFALLSDGGAAQASISNGTAPAATTKKVAVAWAADDVAFSVSGGTQQTDSSATIGFGAAVLRLGAGAGNTNASAGVYIKDLRYFPRRLSNAELEAMVGN